MPWLIVVLSVIEYYSAGVAVLAKRKEKKYWWLNLIPFVAFFYVQEYTRGFKIVMIPVKKWGQTVLIFAAVALVAVLFHKKNSRNKLCGISALRSVVGFDSSGAFFDA